MKRSIVIIFALTFCLLSADQERGLTCKVLEVDSKVVSGRAREYFPSDHELVSPNRIDQIEREGWEPVDSIYIDKFIQAGKHFGVAYNSLNNNLEIMCDQEQLTETGKYALLKSPEWIRAELENVLVQLPPDDQDIPRGPV